MHYRPVLKKIASSSFVELWNVISNPSMIPVRMEAPPESTLEEVVVGLFSSVDPTQVEDYRIEFLMNHKFFQEVSERYISVRKRRPAWQGLEELLYILIRLSRPETVIETGVFDGLSSAVILQALEDNGTGTLVSIDLPATEIIKGSTHRMPYKMLPEDHQPGWVIPEYLKARFNLLLGDSKTLLPVAVKKHPSIDIFFHDSLHTFEHQMFEYQTAWPHLAKGGLLLSDDIFWSPAFHRFCKEQNATYKRYRGFGAMRKGDVR